MNFLPKLFAAIFSIIPGSFVWWFLPNVLWIIKGSFALSVSMYTFSLTIQSINGNGSSVRFRRFAFLMGYLCPANLALLCLERFGTLHGAGIWTILWSFLVLGFGFGRFIVKNNQTDTLEDSQEKSLLAPAIVPALGSLAAAVILIRFSPSFPVWPVFLSIYLGLTFSLFSKNLSTLLRAALSLGGAAFPVLFSLSWFTGIQDPDHLLISALLFTIGFLDGASPIQQKEIH
ncbi:MAG: hypothetical protein HQM10_02570 [Candidatus Riflebacteria bacterium]|nr:hypothetical protein [Candidatus Riflebacteria bacterium]